MSPLKIGLTGGIGSGKTTVANLFAELGITIVDADIIAREVVMPNTDGLQAIVTHFGTDILQQDGQLNRAKLRQIIFDTPAEREWLNQCLHPLIRTQLIEQANTASSCYVIIVVPLLFENGLDNLMDRTLVVDVDTNLQVSRTAQRDQVNADHVQKIIATQISQAGRLAKCDDVIHNQGDIEALREQVVQLDRIYRQQRKT